MYQKGKRYDGLLMTAFVLPVAASTHRLGITVSRKTASRAVDRNRAKRLLRETFRFETNTLQGLKQNYDWVLNGRRAIISVKMAETVNDFQKIIVRVAADEKDSARASGENGSSHIAEIL